MTTSKNISLDLFEVKTKPFLFIVYTFYVELLKHQSASG